MKAILVLFFLLHFSKADSSQSDNRHYNALQSLLNQYQRPFTMVDIGAGHREDSFKVARDYEAVCVMFDENNSLFKSCKAHSELDNIILLSTPITPAILQHLSECEHFDVVLAHRIISEFGQQWQEVAKAVLGMGSHLFIEIPSDDKEIEEYIVAKGGRLITEIPDEASPTAVSRLYLVETKEGHLGRKTWLRSLMHQDLYRIESSFTHKQLIKPSSCPAGTLKTTPWIPGINLCTFKMCRGTYPTAQQLKSELHGIKDVPHTDWLINNMIVQGSRLALIDCDDEQSKRYFSEAALHAHQEILDLEEPEMIEHYFWHTLIKVPISLRQTVKFFNQMFPAFLSIHAPAGSAYAYVKTLSGPIDGVISFKFDVSCKEDLFVCLNHLESLGYTQFNFSLRDLPGFILESNKYTDLHKVWARSSHELLDEITKFARLDHDGNHLWGHIYARLPQPNGN